jgi:hypothetical protein
MKESTNMRFLEFGPTWDEWNPMEPKVHHGGVALIPGKVELQIGGAGVI